MKWSDTPDDLDLLGGWAPSYCSKRLITMVSFRPLKWGNVPMISGRFLAEKNGNVS